MPNRSIPRNTATPLRYNTSIVDTNRIWCYILEIESGIMVLYLESNYSPPHNLIQLREAGKRQQYKIVQMATYYPDTNQVPRCLISLIHLELLN
ncbi:hypothetical protein M8J77_014667 [Diaphorina citri]|nr:hypothetical protein M8J77_014667 [Diaphorina citri]